jgi:transposase
VIRKRIGRAKLLEFFAALPPCVVGIEACPMAHHSSRRLEALSHTVRLMPCGMANSSRISGLATSLAESNTRLIPVCKFDTGPSQSFFDGS